MTKKADFAFSPTKKVSKSTYDRRLGKWLSTTELQLPHNGSNVTHEQARENRAAMREEFQRVHPDLPHDEYWPKGPKV